MQRDRICIEHMLCHTTICHRRCVLFSSVSIFSFLFFVLHSPFLFFFLSSLSLFLHSSFSFNFTHFVATFLHFIFLLPSQSLFLPPLPSCFAHPSREALWSIPRVSKSGGDISVHSVRQRSVAFFSSSPPAGVRLGKDTIFCS